MLREMVHFICYLQCVLMRFSYDSVQTLRGYRSWQVIFRSGRICMFTCSNLTDLCGF